MLRELKWYSRMALGFARWARTPPHRDPLGLVRQTLRDRESNFLDLMRRGVFENPTNPYGQLFRWAGCAYGDLESAVRKDGLEPTLERLRNEGVYLSHDEFKGKVPVRRGSSEFLLDTSRLANPTVTGIIEVSSGGSRSHGTITTRSLEYQLYREAQDRLVLEHYDHGKRAFIMMSSILPGSGGVRRALNFSRWGLPPAVWFDTGGRRSWPYETLTRFMLAELRVLGHPVVFPRMLPPNDFRPVAEFIAHRKKNGQASVMNGIVSRAVRVADAALRGGLDIAGTLILAGGEALTDAKRAVIEAAGCEVHARYTISELGPVGVSCRRMTGNCVHVWRDSVAVISRRRVAPLSETEVESLLFTTVLPCAATILVNVEMDDAGELGEATCDCPLTHLGLTQQINNIFSYGKLTGQGTSLLAGDILTILERSLPARFGGVPGDYQLVEAEGPNQTEYLLRVSPRVQAPSEAEVRSVFLEEVSRLWSGSLTARRWDTSDGIRVVFAEPFLNFRGKPHPLFLLGKPSPAKVERDR